MKALSRREFMRLTIGMGGLTAVSLGARTAIPSFFLESRFLSDDQTVELSMIEAVQEMVDLAPVYAWAYSDPVLGPRIPGPVVFADEGSSVTISVKNGLRENHGFAVPGLLEGGPIAPGETRRFEFPAARAGTYMYLDPMNAPVNRVLGLHGALVVRPRLGNTPFSDPTTPVQRLFNDLGASADFPGDPWKPERSFIWMFSSIDPVLNALVRNGDVPSPEEFVRRFLPRYFTINGKSGFFSSHDPDIAPHGRIGQPALLRVLNAGLATHSPHIHGNHVYLLSENGEVKENVHLVDTWMMRPLDRKNVLLPFIVPPDIPAEAWPPREEHFPMVYPMHCHMEMSQTAGGGNYPQGLVTDWVIDGPLSRKEEGDGHSSDSSRSHS